jgi:hypothetical protein
MDAGVEAALAYFHYMSICSNTKHELARMERSTMPRAREQMMSVVCGCDRP